MAKTGGVSLADLIAGQKNQDVKMSSYMQAQLESQLNTEKVIKDTHKINTITAVETTLSKKDEDKIQKDINKGLLSKTGDGLNSNVIKMAKDIKESLKLSKQTAKEILGKSKEGKEFKSIGQRVTGLKEGVKDFFTMRGFLDKTGIVKRGSGGIFGNMLDSREAARMAASDRIATGERARDPKTGRIMNTADSLKSFTKQAREEQGLRRQQGDLERTIAGYKERGLNDTQISQTKAAKDLNKLAEQFAKVNPMKYATGTDEKGNPLFGKEGSDDGRIKAGPKAPAVDQSESEIENAQIQNQQLDLLTKIEENTRPANAAEGGGEGNGGGILAGIGKGLGALGTGLGKLGGGIGKGIRAILVGLAEGIVALGTAVATGVGALGLAALAGIILTIAAAIRIAAPGIEAFAPVLIKLAEQIGIVAGVIGGVLIEAIKALPEIINSIAGGIATVVDSIAGAIVDTVNAVTDSIERLAKVDGLNLMKVGAGLFAVASGMAAFAGANVVSGISNIATGLMSAVTGQKTPVEQMEQIAKFGPNLNQAGTGMKNLASGLAQFTNIDGDKLKVISQMPVDKIVAMGTAMGQAGMVYDRSAKNREVASVTAQPAAPTVVSAPTVITNSTQQQGFFNTPIRNQDNTLNSYLKSRYVN